MSTDAGAALPLVEGGRVVGVRLGDGSVVAADAAVVATGAAAPGMLAELGVTVVAQDSPAALVRTRPVETGLRVVVNAPRVSLRPTPDRWLVVGSAGSPGNWCRRRSFRALRTRSWNRSGPSDPPAEQA